MRGAFRRWQAETSFPKPAFRVPLQSCHFLLVIPSEPRAYLRPTSAVTACSYAESKPKVEDLPVKL